eukprot:570066-Pelagomonas_calceolata.AAC.3
MPCCGVLHAQEHAAASTCAPDARTLCVLAEAGERQVAQAHSKQVQGMLTQGNSLGGTGNASSSELTGASREQGGGEGGVAGAGVPVALSESMADLKGVSAAVDTGNAGASMDGEAGAAEQGALQLRGNSSLGAGVGAVPSGQRPGVDGGPEGGRVSSAEEAAWGRGVVADARDAEGGARLLWLAAEVCCKARPQASSNSPRVLTVAHSV